MLGTKAYIKLAEDLSSDWTAEQIAGYSINHRNVLDMIKEKDWLMAYIAQHDPRQVPSIFETSFMVHIKSLIRNANLFFRLIPCKSWANADTMRQENFSIIRDAGLEVFEPSGNEDAYFNSGDIEIEMTQLFMTDEEFYNSKPKKIKRKIHGHVEFGTTSIAKTAMLLTQRKTLLRLPYDPCNGMEPAIGVFCVGK